MLDRTVMMQLSTISGLGADWSLGSDGAAADRVDVVGITADSRFVRPGFIFAALAGTRADGLKFTTDALAKGASALVVSDQARLDQPIPVPVLRVANPRRVLALIAAQFFRRQPAHIVAITGTNGKTSVADFTRQLMVAVGAQAASVGTIGVIKPGGAVYGSLTTPDPVTLHQTLDALAAEGVTHLAMEASSHGLDQHRLDGVRLQVGAFLNLGRDHLDYHATVEDYLAAKLRLFSDVLQPGQTAVINVDGPEAHQAVAVAKARGLKVMTTGMLGADLRLVSTVRDGFKQRLTIEYRGLRHEVLLGLIGDYQASNALVAAGLAIATGLDANAVIAALPTLVGVSGRLEVVAAHNGGIAVVDYAHKPEALKAALSALRPFATGQLICLFGCGGDRDRGKRPIMGRIAIDYADVVIVTDDNPRTEDAATIRAEVLDGAKGAVEIGDRGAAVAHAIALLGPGDVVLVAGKGHETGQIVGSTTFPFSDQEAVRAAMLLAHSTDHDRTQPT
jgi:UDP-N-acetylmuramoyl-L-alanyl-D-glutamate--2,6-diaminopimelate ligase